MHLKATRNNRNNWLINQEDLQVWIEARDAKTQSRPDTPNDTTDDKNHQTTITVARLEEQLKAAERRAADLENTLSDERSSQREELRSLKADHQAQLDRRDADYRQAMELLREAQRKRGLVEWLLWRTKP